MRVVIILVAVAVACAADAPGARIVGGSVTTIGQYPFGAALLITWNSATFIQSCGGSIINNRAILSAAHCVERTNNNQWRIRVGSSFASSGGVLHNVNRIIMHPQYNPTTIDSDIAILHSATAFSFNNNVRAGSIAGSNYNLADNQVVWAIGWGLTSGFGSPSEQLRHVQMWSINQAVCRGRYGSIINDNMLCAGWLDVGGRAQCSRDSGGPLIHNGVIVGVCSFGNPDCGHPFYPSVNVRVSRYTAWIQSNA